MEASLCASLPLKLPLISTPTVTKYPNPTVKFTCNRTCKTLTGKNQWLMTTKVSAASIHDVSAVADPARVDITWQIVVGAMVGFFHGSHGKDSSLVKAPLNSSLSVTRLPIGYCSVFRHVVESVCKEVENLKAK
ncbi:Uncharacterized protein TCM_030732 isoform 3 [Theobroma cacao]|uniref:Uncharacterized protein isoform 3 n=1 Tax=Theobroma cacao TaxID=3641 RepID=A0A061F646_THECC|nr:Uncharacterized protein TCM_030732 isoform 3 [Theobroma cacao]